MGNPTSLTVHLGDQSTSAVTTALVYQASDHQPVGATLILGHGAGAGQKSAFMVEFARALSGLGLDVVTFNFPYTEQHRRIPDRAPVLEACFRSTIEVVRKEVASASAALFIGGKSMGGRIASQVAAADHERQLSGLVLLGYPLHPPGRPDARRDKHLPAVRRPMLFVQGTRDPFGSPAELAPLLTALDPLPVVHVVEGGDHSFKVPGRGSGQAAVYARVQQAVVVWISSTIGTR